MASGTRTTVLCVLGGAAAGALLLGGGGYFLIKIAGENWHDPVAQSIAICAGTGAGGGATLGGVVAAVLAFLRKSKET